MMHGWAANGLGRSWSTGLVAVCAALLLASACSSEMGPDAWIDDVALAHASADAASSPNQLERARGRLYDLFTGPVPSDLREAERRVLLQDLAFRVAAIDLELLRAERALAVADEGLALGLRDDLFTANLLVVRGRAQERLGYDARAAQDYYEALRINDLLLQRLLEDAQPGGAPR